MYRAKTIGIQEERSIKPGESAEITVRVAIPAINDILNKLGEVKTLIVTAKPKQFIDDVELTNLLHVSKKTTRKYRNMGLEFVKIGKKIFYNPIKVEEFCSGYTQKAF